MPARRFERIALDLMLGGCAVMFGACVLIEHAQAQPGYVPPPTPLPPPILNPSNPGTVPQPSYQPSRRQHRAQHLQHQARFQVVRLDRLRLKRPRVQPLGLSERPSQQRARSIAAIGDARRSRSILAAI
jgi:hypothetical protein